MKSEKAALKFGVATASAQIEGGAVGSNWNHYSDAGKIRDHSNIRRATDHWNRYEEDIELLDELGIRYYRMSVEWARIEPQEGQWNPEAIAHYRREIQLMRDRGIEVLLTLYHFSHPQWFEDRGAFTRKENIPIFLRFVEYTVEALGDLIPAYCTLNEPNVYAVNCFLFVEWLNEEKKLFKTLRVMSIFASIHLLSYTKIHEIYRRHQWGEVKVSLALHLRCFTPEKDNFIDRAGAKLYDRLFQSDFFRAITSGHFPFPLRNFSGLKSGCYLDAIAINYYSRGMVHAFRHYDQKGVPHNDLGWEIYPEGLIQSAESLYNICPLPIMITENGCCDQDDRFRPRFIYEHVRLLEESSLPITHYYHWCFVDNFEWKEGERPRFGLVACDYETQKRSLKKSALMYRELIRQGGTSQDIYETYVRGIEYPMNEAERG